MAEPLERAELEWLGGAIERAVAAATELWPAEHRWRPAERVCGLLSIKHRTAKACRPLAAHFLHRIKALRASPFAPLASLGETLNSWKDEIARMWRFTRSNGITEGFHTKMEVLQRQAYGFRNFRNYQLRVVVMCS